MPTTPTMFDKECDSVAVHFYAEAARTRPEQGPVYGHGPETGWISFAGRHGQVKIWRRGSTVEIETVAGPYTRIDVLPERFPFFRAAVAGIRRWLETLPPGTGRD